MKTTRVWGLTGGIASGKSTAASFFAQAGIPVIDADQIARELSSPGGAAYPEILKRFKTTDRAQLRALIFADPLARADLEAILHPLIRKDSERRIANSQSPHLIYEAALLVESGRYRDFPQLVVVQAPLEIRLSRLMSRDGMDRTSAERMIQSQVSDEIRLKSATHVIENSGSRSELEQKVRALITKFFV